MKKIFNQKNDELKKLWKIFDDSIRNGMDNKQYKSIKFHN